MNALVYLRRSKKSESDTVSLKAQEAVVRAYAREHGINIIEKPLVHDGVSGTKRARFDVIDEMVTSAGANAVLVYHLDRFARDSDGAMEYLKALRRRNVDVIECAGAGKIDVSSSQGKLTTRMRTAFDEYYANVVGEKTSAALAHLRAQGKVYNRHAPFGYRKQDGYLVLDDEEQRALGIINICRLKQMGARLTLKELERQGYEGRRSLRVLHKLLRPPA